MGCSEKALEPLVKTQKYSLSTYYPPANRPGVNSYLSQSFYVGRTGYFVIKHTQGEIEKEQGIKHDTIRRFQSEPSVAGPDGVYRCRGLMCCLGHTGGTYRGSGWSRWSSGTHGALGRGEKKH